MVNRIDTDRGRESDKLTKSAHSYITQNPAARNINRNENMIVDDVIAHLANAHENRRARQVTEWERMGGQSMQRAA